MNDLVRIRNDYETGLLNKNDYRLAVANKLKILKEIPAAMTDGIIEDIHISKESTVFSFVFSNGLRFKLSCNPAALIDFPEAFLAFPDIEFDEFKVMSRLIKNKDVIFDIGANVGWYSILYKKMFPDAKVYSFEPIPDTYSQLKKNILLNELDDSKLLNFGLSDNNGQVEFFIMQIFPEHLQ